MKTITCVLTTDDLGYYKPLRVRPFDLMDGKRIEIPEDIVLQLEAAYLNLENAMTKFECFLEGQQ